jgi:nitronate monooxygenase
MAGGPSTPELAAAVTRAGGLGMLAGAYRAPDLLAADIARARALTDGPLGVNLFVPVVMEDAPGRLERYLERLAPEARRYGAQVGTPRDDDDGWQAKLELIAGERIEVASFTFGCPSPRVIDHLRAAGSEVWVTVNEPGEATEAHGGGADVLVVQGVEAGGHQGGWRSPDDPEGFGLLALLRVVAAHTSLPVVAAGGLTDGAGVAAALAAGARAAQAGTAFLRAAEAGTDPAYRAALRGGGRTELTRAFSGRRARGLRNRFIRDFGPHAPSSYPALLHATAPIRAKAREAGDADGLSLWAGQAHRLAADATAEEIVAELVAGARAALDAAAARLAPPS